MNFDWRELISAWWFFGFAHSSILLVIFRENVIYALNLQLMIVLDEDIITLQNVECTSARHHLPDHVLNFKWFCSDRQSMKHTVIAWSCTENFCPSRIQKSQEFGGIFNYILETHCHNNEAGSFCRPLNSYWPLKPHNFLHMYFMHIIRPVLLCFLSNLETFGTKLKVPTSLRFVRASLWGQHLWYCPNMFILREPYWE